MQKQNLLKRQTEEEDDVTPKIKKQKVPKNLSQFMKNTYAGKCLLAANVREIYSDFNYCNFSEIYDVTKLMICFKISFGRVRVYRSA